MSTNVTRLYDWLTNTGRHGTRLNHKAMMSMDTMVLFGTFSRGEKMRVLVLIYDQLYSSRQISPEDIKILEWVKSFIARLGSGDLQTPFKGDRFVADCLYNHLLEMVQEETKVGPILFGRKSQKDRDLHEKKFDVWIGKKELKTSS